MSATIGAGVARVRPNSDGAVRRRRPAGAAALLAAALALSGGGLAGCETLYFHSDADQKAMEQARAGLDAAKKSQLDALAAQRTTLADLGTQQRAMAVRSQLTLRDDTLAIIIDSPNPPKPQNWRDRIESYAKSDMVELVGAEQMPKAIFRGAVETTEPGDLFVASWMEGARLLERTRRQAKNAEADYVRAGGTLTSPCAEQGSVVPIASATGPLEQQAQALNRHCQRLARVWNETEGLYAPAADQPKLLGCVMGARNRCSGEPDGLVFEAYRELAEVDSLIAANAKMEAATRTHLAALEKTYQCAVERERAPGPSERVRDAAKLVEDFVGVLPTSGAAVTDKLGSAASPATSAAASGPAAAAANANPQCPGGSQERLSFAGLLGKADLTPEGLSAILAKTGQVGGADAVAAALSQAKQQFAESRLATVLQAVAPVSATDSAATKPAAASGQQDPAAVAAAGVVAALNPLYRIARVRSGDLPETRAILTDLAMARYEQSRARIELDRLNRSREFLQLRAYARLQQAASLQAALGYTDPCRYLPADGKKSCKQPPQRERALIALADAWNRGAVPAAAAEVDLRGIDYASLMSREQAAVTADYAVLDPLVTELQIYAAGGFTAEEIARAISAAGIVAIAVGVN